MEIDIKAIKELLNCLKDDSGNARIFCSEAQFQFEFALAVQHKYPGLKILLEFLSAELVLIKDDEKRDKTERWYSDIIILDKEKKEYYVIELKYKTSEWKNVKDFEYPIDLKTHGAEDLGRFDYLWDVFRIQTLKGNKTDIQFVSYRNNMKIEYKLKKQGFLNQFSFKKGFAIILTNEPKYWREDKNKDQDVLYCNFRINEGHTIKGDLKWSKNSKTKACYNAINEGSHRDKNIQLTKEYKIEKGYNEKKYPITDDYNWCLYYPEEVKDSLKEKNEFRYLVLDI